MVGTDSNMESRGGQGVQPERLRKASLERKWGLGLAEWVGFVEGKALEAEDPTEAKTGTGLEHGLSKGLWEANHLLGFEGTKA